MLDLHLDKGAFRKPVHEGLSQRAARNTRKPFKTIIFLHFFPLPPLPIVFFWYPVFLTHSHIQLGPPKQSATRSDLRERIPGSSKPLSDRAGPRGGNAPVDRWLLSDRVSPGKKSFLKALREPMAAVDWGANANEPDMARAMVSTSRVVLFSPRFQLAGPPSPASASLVSQRQEDLAFLGNVFFSPSFFIFSTRSFSQLFSMFFFFPFFSSMFSQFVVSFVFPMFFSFSSSVVPFFLSFVCSPSVFFTFSSCFCGMFGAIG